MFTTVVKYFCQKINLKELKSNSAELLIKLESFCNHWSQMCHLSGLFGFSSGRQRYYPLLVCDILCLWCVWLFFFKQRMWQCDGTVWAGVTLSGLSTQTHRGPGCKGQNERLNRALHCQNHCYRPWLCSYFTVTKCWFKDLVFVCVGLTQLVSV